MKQFIGPIFLLGMPRSGTKLLRGLLLEHSSIGIPKVETEFLPLWVRQWNSYGDLSKYDKFLVFYHSAVKLPYFQYMAINNTLISSDAWFGLCKEFSPAGVFEALIRHDVNIPYGAQAIWGDKSPSYIDSLPIIKEQFPQAKIIHIVRDVRDYCLSINKAWGKNMFRASQRWVDSVTKVKEDSRVYPNDYLEIHYESLLENPRTNLINICEFLELEFEENMLNLSTETENFGAAKQKKEIVFDNKEKYKTLMKDSVRSKIESIAAPTLREYGYSVDNYSVSPERVSSMMMRIYRLQDSFSLIRSKAAELGFLGALKFHTRYYFMLRGKNNL